VREHGVERFLIHLGLELVAILERDGALQPRQLSTFSTIGLTRSKLACAIGFGNSSMR